MGDKQAIALVGGGVIGAGWAARFLLNGHDVSIFDPDPEIERKLLTVIGAARRAYAKLFPNARLSEGDLRIEASIATTVARADFVQESLPEREDLKRSILAEIEHDRSLFHRHTTTQMEKLATLAERQGAQAFLPRGRRT